MPEGFAGSDSGNHRIRLPKTQDSFEEDWRKFRVLFQQGGCIRGVPIQKTPERIHGLDTSNTRIKPAKPAIRFRQNGKTVQAMLEERIEKTDGRMAKGGNKFRVFVCSDSGNVGKQRSNPLYQTET